MCFGISKLSSRMEAYMLYHGALWGSVWIVYVKEKKSKWSSSGSEYLKTE
jgi:hypothetical protein